MNAIECSQFKELIGQGCTVIDTRQPEIFCESFIKGSVSIPFGENFTDAFNELTEPDQKILIVAEETETVAIAKTIKDAGIENAVGFLQGGFEAWKNAENKIDMLITIEVDEFALDYQFDEFYLVDVRSKEEFIKDHAEDAENIVLNDLEQILTEFETDDSYYVYANSFNEAVTAGSIFKKTGFNRIRVVAADYETIKKSGIPLFIQKKKENSSSRFSDN
jgi:rhodanese-related sulfurtransferase